MAQHQKTAEKYDNHREFKKHAKSWNAVRIGEKTISLEQIIKIHNYSIED